MLLPAQDSEVTGGHLSDHTFTPIYHIVGLDSGTDQTQTPSLVKEGERKLRHQERGASSLDMLYRIND